VGQPAPSERPAPAAQQPSPNPVAHAWGNMVGMVGALTGLIPFVGH
jgi:predicted lipid-binding transport protein (Tim44 family)